MILIAVWLTRRMMTNSSLSPPNKKINGKATVNIIELTAIPPYNPIIPIGICKKLKSNLL
jgi:hypothetical protein